MTDHQVGSAIPIFRVANVRTSLGYYVDALGFKVEWDDGGIASVIRDRCVIFLCEWDQGQSGTWAWVDGGDVEALHAELAQRGARIRQGPTNFPWALEMQVEDLDQNVIRFGSDPKSGEAFGKFLDAKGVLWDIPSD